MFVNFSRFSVVQFERWRLDLDWPWYNTSLVDSGTDFVIRGSDFEDFGFCH